MWMVLCLITIAQVQAAVSEAVAKEREAVKERVMRYIMTANGSVASEPNLITRRFYEGERAGFERVLTYLSSRGGEG
ncbi:hypothetical protein EOD42_23280 [Rhodovarius crocodyli]|uniref:Uncharacterized protein n=1 Tax=Rhodovarius crocodyli TaxID=1979269 RepID=A0A437LZA7_9PROT|nr:hypothetical protein [Rhodovarius crocodyli]RVT90727.1 hypothetical protein EOD42_23280 [Rhodovarius crocodyli]